jgi:autotransporter translocation and assembly factor TamB
VAKYKLLAGTYIGADKTQKPDDKGKHPSKTYAVGEVFESDIDLVGKHGYEKFELVGGEVKAAPTQNKFPHGQVSSGFQVDTKPAGPADLEGGRMEYVAETADDAKAASEGKPVEAHVVGSQTQDDLEAEEDPGTAEDGGEEGGSVKKGHAKDAKVGHQAKAQELPANLYTMNLDQLHAFAKDNKIDLKGAAKKDDVVKAIKASKGK